MNSVYILAFALLMVIVHSAPVTKAKPTPLVENRSKNVEVERERSFEKFFAKISEEVMEETEMDVQKIVEAENALIEDFPAIFGKEDTKSTQRKRRSLDESAEKLDEKSLLQSRLRRSIKDHQDVSRIRRSTFMSRHNTMMRTSYRSKSFFRRSKDVFCKRRCYWKAMYHLCHYGVVLNEPCEC